LRLPQVTTLLASHNHIIKIKILLRALVVVAASCMAARVHALSRLLYLLARCFSSTLSAPLLFSLSRTLPDPQLRNTHHTRHQHGTETAEHCACRKSKDGQRPTLQSREGMDVQEVSEWNAQPQGAGSIHEQVSTPLFHVAVRRVSRTSRDEHC